MSTGLFLERRREHLDDAADLVVAADHRVELPAGGELGEVAAEAFEGLVLVLGLRVFGALRPAKFLKDDQNGVAREPVAFEDVGDGAALGR